MNYNEECKVDADEYRINFYIKEMEMFIDEYGYNKKIASIDENCSIEELENRISNFLKNNSKGLDYLEILGTLKNTDKEIYVCCYEPYGDEIFCVEKRDCKLYFFNIKEYEKGIKMKHINYIEKSF